ncbi:MAG TPA: glutaredoxin domain-containing protein [Polyangiaceae bacterium]|nr:glutaredoxin domain-containing protein [Polyangiaceae bacterium]
MATPSTPTPAPVAEVVMYRTRHCGYCNRAAQLLRQKGVELTEIDVSNNPECRRWLLTATGMRTVPQIFINGRSVRGFDDVAELDRKGALDRLLREPPKEPPSFPAFCRPGT